MGLTYRQRIALLAGLSGVLGLLLLGRLFAMQVAGGGRAREEAAREVAEWRPVHPRRGRILDAKGRELVADEAGYELTVRAAAWLSVMHECPRCGLVRFFRPGQSAGRCTRCRHGFRPVDRRDVGRVAGLLGIRPAELLERVDARVAQAEAVVEKELEDLPPRERKQQRALLWADHGWRLRRVARDVPYEVAREVELHPHENPALKVRTVLARRSYGGRDFCHVLGDVRRERVDVDAAEGDLRFETATGLSGVERAFDGALSGEPGWLRILRDPRDGEGRVVARRAPRHGLDVRLTIAAEDQARAVAALSGATGALVVVDAWNGDVLAAASAPGYEPGEYGRVLLELQAEYGRTRVWPDHHALKDAAFGDFHVPGSIVKPFTAVAALLAGVSTPGTRVVCERYFANRRGQRLSELKCNGEHGEVDLHEALVRSCNIYFQTLQREMVERGAFARFTEVQRRFGFGRPTGIELEPDPFPDTRGAARDWAERILAAIGQGRMRLSPAQVARAYAALFTGALPRLRLAAEVGGRPLAPERTPLGLPEEQLSAVRAALLEVPRRGTAAGYGLDRWPVAVKTGTAQLGKRGLHDAWIAGFLPAHRGRPPVAFALAVLDTEVGGAEACAPRLAAFLRAFYGESGE